MSRPFELQGHRGARGLFPENTLEGFRGALAVGVTSVELDVATTADDVLVVTHDPILNPDLTRRPDGAWLSAPGPAVRALRLVELETYDVSEARPGGEAALAHQLQRGVVTARIPTLEAVFEALAPSGVVVDVEIKTDPIHPELSSAACRDGRRGGCAGAAARRPRSPGDPLVRLARPLSPAQLLA